MLICSSKTILFVCLISVVLNIINPLVWVLEVWNITCCLANEMVTSVCCISILVAF